MQNVAVRWRLFDNDSVLRHRLCNSMHYEFSRHWIARLRNWQCGSWNWPCSLRLSNESQQVPYPQARRTQDAHACQCSGGSFWIIGDLKKTCFLRDDRAGRMHMVGEDRCCQRYNNIMSVKLV